MQGNTLDKFIAEFEHLRSEAGWTSNDIGTITQFQHGLNTGLLKAIVQHVCLLGLSWPSAQLVRFTSLF